MLLIPEVKKIVLGEKIAVNGYHFTFEKNTDARVINATKDVKEGKLPVHICAEDGEDEAYTIDFSVRPILLTAKSQRGAFYGVQTLKQILKNGYCDAEKIEDRPDFSVRGFYFDMTRGRITKLETLKKLVDQMAYYKQNMLQLYIEHTFEFEEYQEIIKKTGYMTKEETVQLVRYCDERFIELTPSLSCFGHLYELLQSKKYQHLCELENYQPTSITWRERMAHHTIDAYNPESFQVITHLIDQYLPLFTSNKFNICCDETFDLCNGRNAGKDKGQTYLTFLKKLVDYVLSKGKQPMMWGDIICHHPEYIKELDERVIFGSWCYQAEPSDDMVTKFHNENRLQYVCPGNSCWSSLTEMTNISIPNITKMASLGKEYGACGFLNTGWGDFGHAVNIEGMMYSTIFGFAKSWNENVTDFNRAIDLHYYGFDGASSTYLTMLSAISRTYWYDICAIYSNELFKNNVMRHDNIPFEELETVFNTCEDVIVYFMSQTWGNEDARKTILNICQGTEIFVAMLNNYFYGEKFGMNLQDCEQWMKDYSEIYLKQCKEGELKEILHVVYTMAQKYLVNIHD